MNTPLSLGRVIRHAVLPTQLPLASFGLQRFEVIPNSVTDSRSLCCPRRPAVEHQRVELVWAVVWLWEPIAFLDL